MTLNWYLRLLLDEAMRKNPIVGLFWGLVFSAPFWALLLCWLVIR